MVTQLPLHPGSSSTTAASGFLQPHQGQVWSWTSQEQALADGHVPVELRWPIPVICRNINELHQRETRLIHADDILDFVEHELHGEEWTPADLEEALKNLYDGGEGNFDSSSIIRGPTSFRDYDTQVGAADAVVAHKRPFSDIFPSVSRKPPTGLVGEFLQQVERTDKSAARAHIMLRAEGVAPTDLPWIEEDEEDLPEEHIPGSAASECEPEYVGAATLCERKKGKRRSTLAGVYPATEFMNSIADSGLTRRVSAKRGSGKSKSSFDLIIVNSSGKPQLLAAMETKLGASVLVNQEHHCHRSAFTDLQYEARDLGWKLVGAPAHATAKDGFSAGVAVAARNGIGIGPIGKKFDHSPSSCPGRVAAAWIHAGPKTGIVFISVYLFHTRGRNRQKPGHRQ